MTHHNALDMQQFCASPRNYLKRLVVGFEKVPEINRNFVTKGCRTPQSEFTMMEFYEAYANYHADGFTEG